MNINDYTSLINKPNAINDIQCISLEKIVQQFPYFQSSRALYLKGLYNQNSFKYNNALKITAAHTTDRSVLFEFITSNTFTAIDKGLYDEKVAEILNISVNESEILTGEQPKLKKNKNTVEESLLTSIKNASIGDEVELVEFEFSTDDKIPKIAYLEPIISEKDFIKVEKEEKAIEEKLELGKPLDFSISEKHSFQEWLQISKFRPIIREEEIIDEQIAIEVSFDKQKKNEIIDKFIESSPKITPIKHDTSITASINLEPSSSDNSYLMTETLARVYLEQKKYQKAIQAYQILILKYPEKSSFFANRILDIKNLQQNNT